MARQPRGGKPDRNAARVERLVQRARCLLDNWEDEAESDRAREMFRQAIALAPDHPEAWRGLADALEECEEFDEALAAYHRAIALGADSPALWRHLAVTASLVGEREEALAAAERALAQAPDDPTLLNDYLDDYVQVLTRVGLPGGMVFPLDQVARPELLERALAALERKLALESAGAMGADTVWALTCRGGLLMQLGRREEALATFERLRQLAPTARHAYFVKDALWGAARGRALALERLGRREEALAALEEGLARLDDDEVETEWKTFHAQLLLDLGRPEEALGAIEQVLREFRLDVPALRLRARILEALGRSAEAQAAQAAAEEARSLHEQRALRPFIPTDPLLASLLPE